MALALLGYRLILNVMDVGRNISRVTYHMTAADYVQASIDAALLIPRLQAVSDGVISGYTLNEVHTDAAIVLPAAGVQVENKGQIAVELVIDAKKATIRIPAVTDSIMVAATGENNNVIDIGDAAVVAYVGTFEAGGEATLSDGDEVSSALSGKRIHVKNSNG